LNKKRVIAFILAYKDKPYLPLYSLSHQTLKPDRVVIVAAFSSACIDKFYNLTNISCIVVSPNLSLSVGERVGIALTIAFKKMKIDEYDYVIKLDDDVLFDEKFVEDNIDADYDLVGYRGAMILKSKRVIEILDGRWIPSPLDDALVIDVFRAKGCKILPWTWVHPPLYMKEPKDTFRRGIRFGIELYRMGYPFMNLVLSIPYNATKRRMEIHVLMGILIGYIITHMRREKRSHLSIKLRDMYRRSLIEFIRQTCCSSHSRFKNVIISRKWQ